MGRRGWLLGMLGMVMPGLGGLQPPPQNSVPAGTIVPGVQPGVSGGIIRARQLIIAGSAGEALVYSPSAALGNLIASVAGAAFTDNYGNAGVPGVASYSGSGSSWTATSLAGGSFGAGISFYTATSAGGPWTRQATMDYVAADSGIAVAATSFILNTTTTQLVNTGIEIPTSPAGITTVAELITALTNVGIFS